MRQRNVRNADDIIEKSCDIYINDLDDKKGKFKGKYTKLYVEIGMGKGTFLSQHAFENRDIMYIGIELSKSVVALAIKKFRKFEQENNINLTNIKFISLDAIMLDEVFEQGEIDKIYLNFSDPWPKKKHEKRRLLSDDFLKVYSKILKKDGIIEFKTDNRGLFEYSILNINKSKLNILEMCLDLHKTDIPNIMTEYEEKFSPKGPIYKMVFEVNN